MFEQIFTAAIVLAMTVALILEWYRPSVIIFSALLALYLGGVLTVKETFSGFSNHGMLTVAALFIVANALQSSNTFEFTVEKLLGKGSHKTIYLRLMAPVTFLSAFLNNTPIVASLIPVIKKWTKKNNLQASKFMIPLSYAAILGGICTLIGTSTNLVVHGLMLDHGMPGFSFFEIGKVGFPIAILVIVYFAFLGHRLLPQRKDVMMQFTDSSREFVVGLKVGVDFPYLGKTIEEAHLRHLKGLFLFQIIRNNKEIAPVGPTEKLRLNDRLFFTGMPETIYELIKIPGLNLIKDSEFDIKNIDSDKLKTFEAVISNSSPLIGQTVRDSGFRTKYGAVILGIHRNGHRINKKVGDIKFLANDTLFILAKKDFEEKWYHSTDFSLVSTSVRQYSKPKAKGNFALILLAMMVFSVTFGLIESMLIAAALTAGIMIVTNIISFNDARKSIDFDVLLVIAAALGIGKAMENSGVAEIMAQNLISGLGGFGVIGIIAGLFFITSIYTEIITNNAAAAIIFPVALSTAHQMGLAVHPLMITIAIAASSSFATPIGYQTNMMVYNPGGYKFTDFLQTGLIINVIVGVLTTLSVYFMFYAN